MDTHTLPPTRHTVDLFKLKIEFDLTPFKHSIYRSQIVEQNVVHVTASSRTGTQQEARRLSGLLVIIIIKNLSLCVIDSLIYSLLLLIVLMIYSTCVQLTVTCSCKTTVKIIFLKFSITITCHYMYLVISTVCKI
jgi:hypothetical protein